jgi:hypothetical protein
MLRDNFTRDVGKVGEILPGEMIGFQNAVLFIEGYIIPFLLIFGISGNIFSFIIFVRNRKRADAPVQYLSVLALSDNGVIFTLGVPHWFTYGLHYVTDGKHSFNMHTYSNFGCKMFLSLWHVFGCISAWLIVAFSIERAFIVWFPLKRALITKRKRSAIIVVISFMSICVSIHRFILVKTYVVASVDSCWYLADDLREVFILWQIDSIFFTYLPCLFIIIANIFILLGVVRAKRAVSGKAKGQSQEHKIIVSLMLISIFYIIFMLPASASFSYMLYCLIYPFEDNFIFSLNNIVTFFDEFSMFNYSFNFIIYGCTLPFYRKEAYAMLCTRKRT